MKNLACLVLVLLGSFNWVGALVAKAESDQEWFTEDQVNTINQEFAVDLSVVPVTSPLSRSDREATENRLQLDMKDNERFAQRADRALENMMKHGAAALARKGYTADAKQLQFEYDEFYSNAIYNTALGIVPTDLGDHKPLSQWLADWYKKMEAKLGHEVCVLLHLDDINTMNYGIPVVFRPRGEDRAGEPQGPWGQDEYKLHFVPVSGVVTYWTVWIVCTAGTWGMGAVTFICTPVAWVSEKAEVKYIGPKLSDWVYTRYNP